jgi:hypothetical protein
MRRLRVWRPWDNTNVRFVENDLLGLVEIGDMPCVVDATAEVAGTSAVSRTSADQSKREVLAIDRGMLQVES